MNRSEQSEPATRRAVKCVVWDLDNTVWDGTLAEGDDVALRAGILETITALDMRGILNSIASRNDEQTALRVLQRLGIADYFVAPKIGWNDKPGSIRDVAKDLNLSLDTFAFIDDQPIERDQVAHELPAVRCFDQTCVADLVDRLGLRNAAITEESRERRGRYQTERIRQEREAEFEGSPAEFLATLDMIMTISRARDHDLARAKELTLRTSQLNTTGRAFTLEQLQELAHSDSHRLLVAGLEDRYGSYGKIGLALIATGPSCWTLELLLTSCRVMSRGVGNVLLGIVMAAARDAGVTLRARFRRTPQNRIMLITFRFAGFYEVPGAPDLLEHPLTNIAPVPQHLRLIVEPWVPAIAG